MDDPKVIAALIGAAAGILAAVIGYFVQSRLLQARIAHETRLAEENARAELARQQEVFRQQFQRDVDDMRTRFMAEAVAKRLLNNENYRRRSFDAIKRRLGGFDDDDLRRILVRAGAIRFIGKSGKEYWGLIERNEDALLVDREKADPDADLSDR